MKSENLPESLKTGDELFSNCLNSIEKIMKDFWSRPLHDHYTNHGFDHTQRIVKILGKLLKNYSTPLNGQERFILIASAYLHDIGMQSPQHAGLDRKPSYSIKELEKVRENHHEASAMMINKSVSKESEFSLGLEHCKQYASAIANVSKHHRKLDIGKITDTSIAGEKIRLKLLAALLKLADGLDADFRRVNIDLLKVKEIPVESKFHWWFHYYVQSIFIEKGHIRLYFRFPEEHCEDGTADIFCERVEESILNLLDGVYDILENYGLRLYPNVKIEERNCLSNNSLEPIPDDLLEYINRDILKIKELAQEKTLQTGASWYVDGVIYSDDIEIRTCLANMFKLIEQEKNFEAVKEIERCRTLTMTPKEKMIFSLIAGNCCYILGKLYDAENYYLDLLSISDRRDLQNIYGENVIRSRAASLGNIGLIYSHKGDLDEALRSLQEAISLYRSIGYKHGEANQLTNIGNIYSDKGNLDEALKYHEKALKIYREIECRRGEALARGNLGVVLRSKGSSDEALKYHEKALKINREIGHKRGEATQLGNIGLIYSDKGDLDEALKYHEKALKINREIGHKRGEATQLGNIGLIYSDKGDLDEALKYHEKALKINREIGHKRGNISFRVKPIPV